MSTVTELKTLTRNLLDVNSSDLPDSRIVPFMNMAQNKIVNLMMEKDQLQQYDDQNHGDLPEGYIDIVSGQNDYDITEDENFVDMLYIAKVYIKETSDNIEYVELRRTDKENLDPIEGTPRVYRISGKTLLIKPTPNYAASDGIYVQFGRPPQEITTADTTKKVGLPSTFHHLLALYTAYFYARSKTLANRNEFLNEALIEENKLGLFTKRKTADTVFNLEAEPVNPV